jgi:hypothetical protein
MHVGQILLVEAESHEEALDKVKSAVQYSETPNPSWSDWNEIGGRWSDFFGKGKNVLRYTENTALAEEKLGEWIACRTTEIKRYHSEIENFNLAGVVATYDAEADWRNFVGQTSMDLWRLSKLAKLLSDDWTPDSAVFDLEDYTANLKRFRERVAVAPEMQYLVMVDFHF